MLAFLETIIIVLLLYVIFFQHFSGSKLLASIENAIKELKK